MKGFNSASIVLTSFILLSNPVLSAERCDSVMARLSARERDLISLNGSFILQSSNTNKRLKSLTLGYVVPTTQFPSGVFLVKSRHTILTSGAAPVSGNSVVVERQKYISPCSNKQVDPYADQVSPDRYIDYHFYGLNDSSLEHANADIGLRPMQSFFLPTRTRCLNTRYSTITAQFLYDDTQHHQEDRRPATTYETLARQGILFSQAIGRKSQYVAPPQYREYDAMKTEVVPYNRTPNKAACFMITIAIPSNASTTEIMIVDADDAFSNPWDPQKSVSINWSQPAETYVSSIRRYQMR